MMKLLWNRARARREGDDGFTLVELLVVVVIIGILVAIAIPVFLSQREKAWESAVQSDLRNAAPLAESHFATNGTYVGFTPVAPTVGVTFAAGWRTASAYCVQATHANLKAATDIWSFTSTGGVVKKGACGAAPAA